ncbi:hypothetical protein BHM03_00026563 [Ensete ventricosum]|uniref:Uncharacterized protein n=1 Tax=Ensete ventricosum TaxID=4639 RepID=A0A426ZYJ9_ENSVE|nr:hypothetical protein B296_00017099 [Ensete ventricosum]RZR97390.1 hypothetical protein BHM03_00026563 [Ensete ventricosum]
MNFIDVVDDCLCIRSKADGIPVKGHSMLRPSRMANVSAVAELCTLQDCQPTARVVEEGDLRKVIGEMKDLSHCKILKGDRSTTFKKDMSWSIIVMVTHMTVLYLVRKKVSKQVREPSTMDDTESHSKVEPSPIESSKNTESSAQNVIDDDFGDFQAAG